MARLTISELSDDEETPFDRPGISTWTRLDPSMKNGQQGQTPKDPSKKSDGGSPKLPRESTP